MNNSIITYDIKAEGLVDTRFETAYFTTNIHIANFLTGVSYFYIQLITILESLIISSVKQKLTIELFKTTERACNDLTVLSCDLNVLLKVVSGYGMPLIVIKSI